MRTTLTLDSDVAARLRQRMRSRKKSLKAVVNEALRVGLDLKASGKRRQFVVHPHSSPFVPGFDPQKLNQAVDELEAEAVARKSTG
jgi:hypothetical protein